MNIDKDKDNYNKEDFWDSLRMPPPSERACINCVHLRGHIFTCSLISSDEFECYSDLYPNDKPNKRYKRYKDVWLKEWEWNGKR